MTNAITKTALVLGGGGSRGAYEIGVWKALKELDINIDIVTGTSVGAINGAMVAQGDLALSEKLWKQMETDMIFDVDTTGMPAEDALAYAKEIILHGGAGTTGLGGLLREYINEEKIRRSPVDYGLVVTAFPSLEAEYLYKDDIASGRLIDHIMASASCFPAAQKYVIDDKKFIDGGYRDNLPVEMALEKGADRIIAVDLQAAGIVRLSTVEKAKKTAKEFYIIKSPVSLGNFLIFDKLNTTRIMRVGYLDTMRRFGRYDGEKYTFEKDSFSKHDLMGADNAAYILKLDPCVVYDRETLIRDMREHMDRLTLKEIMMTPKEAASNLLELKGEMSEELREQMLVLIAKDLKYRQEKSLFLRPQFFNIAETEIQAANFLIEHGLIK